ncbi:hypothetical protein SD78_3161 [Bacillus badius]|nr:hypothetical protein SD78_3161 [Bacillus badius]
MKKQINIFRVTLLKIAAIPLRGVAFFSFLHERLRSPYELPEDCIKKRKEKKSQV